MIYDDERDVVHCPNCGVILHTMEGIDNDVSKNN